MLDYRSTLDLFHMLEATDIVSVWLRRVIDAMPHTAPLKRRDILALFVRRLGAFRRHVLWLLPLEDRSHEAPDDLLEKINNYLVNVAADSPKDWDINPERWSWYYWALTPAPFGKLLYGIDNVGDEIDWMDDVLCQIKDRRQREAHGQDAVMQGKLLALREETKLLGQAQQELHAAFPEIHGD